MREQNIDMWVLIAREYVEDPVVDTMLDAESCMLGEEQPCCSTTRAGAGRSSGSP